MKRGAVNPAPVDMAVKLGKMHLQNPIVLASGTFGYGREYEDFIDISNIGALVVKGTTLEKRNGNPPPRIVETPAGMLNAIGLENPGIEVFLNEHLPYLRERGVAVIANIAGNTVEEYAAIASLIERQTGIVGIELNISCPNVKKGGLQFGTDPEMVYQVVDAVKGETSLPVIPKLSPNVTDIVEIAKAAEAGGADALSMINTLMGMAVDIEKRKPVLGNIFGGLSGPAIKPVALRMVYQVYREVNLPIIGGGGIMNYIDALEFIMVGATAVSIGTANFISPCIARDILEDLKGYLRQHKLGSIRELVGAAVQE